LSKAPESTFNTSSTTAADYVRVTAQDALEPILPKMRQIKRGDLLGSSASGLAKVCNDYWTHPGIPIADELTDFDGFAGKLAFRALGGTPANTPLDSTAEQWDCARLADTVAAGDQLPGTSVISLLGSASYRFSGCVTESFEMMQEGSRPVKWKANLVGTGKHAHPHGVSSIVTTEPTQKCPYGQSSKFIWTDAASSTVDWSSTGRVRGWGIGFKHNLILNDERQGDGTSTPTSGGTAYHVGRIRRGKFEVTSAYVKLAMAAADVAEWIEASKSSIYTDVTWRAQGALITGSIYERLQFVAASAVIDAENISMENENDLTVLNIPLLVLNNNIAAQVINQTASATGYA
jgi:hypothetical protein